jgi:hypothetical protein
VHVFLKLDPIQAHYDYQAIIETDEAGIMNLLQEHKEIKICRLFFDYLTEQKKMHLNFILLYFQR